MRQPTPVNVDEAAKRIRGIQPPVPFLRSNSLSSANHNVYFQCEFLNNVGSFKLRGASNKLLSLTEDERQNGVITYSTGNHGIAVAYVAQKLNSPATICLSKQVPKSKVDRLLALSARLYFVESGQDEAADKAYELTRQENLAIVEPFDDLHIIAGQGTVAREILQKMPDLTQILVPLSGGGLLGGIAMYIKHHKPEVHVVGVSMSASPVMICSINTGKPVSLPESSSLADSLQGGIGIDNRYTFDLIRKYVDELVLVSETDIETAMLSMYSQERMVLEGAAVVGVAAILSGKVKVTSNTVVVLTGNNVDMDRFTRLIYKS